MFELSLQGIGMLVSRCAAVPSFLPSMQQQVQPLTIRVAATASIHTGRSLRSGTQLQSSYQPHQTAISHPHDLQVAPPEEVCCR
jgi:hypothetical protein